MGRHGAGIRGRAVVLDRHGRHDDATDAVEIDMPEMVVRRSPRRPTCVAVIAIGQCATFGGYPGCKPPITTADARSFDTAKSQTGCHGRRTTSCAAHDSSAERGRQGHQRSRLPDEPLVVRPDGRLRAR